MSASDNKITGLNISSCQVWMHIQREKESHMKCNYPHHARQFMSMQMRFVCIWHLPKICAFLRIVNMCLCATLWLCRGHTRVCRCVDHVQHHDDYVEDIQECVDVLIMFNIMMIMSRTYESVSMCWSCSTSWWFSYLIKQSDGSITWSWSKQRHVLQFRTREC